MSSRQPGGRHQGGRSPGGHQPQGRASGAPSQRQLRVGEAVRHALAEALARGDVHDPDLAGASVTVSEVRMSPDLRNATAYVMPLGGAHLDQTLAALTRAAPAFRGPVARAVGLKYAPALRFERDTSFEYAQRIDAVLRREDVARDLTATASEADDAAGDRAGRGEAGGGA